MPDYTVSGDVDSMLRSANDAAIRSAIGVGTTDAPTFLGLSVTGQSLISNGTATNPGIAFASNLDTGIRTIGGADLRLTVDGYDAAIFSQTQLNLQSNFASIVLGSSGAEAILTKDAAGILAQRNGVNAQAFRVYNSTDATPATNFDRALFGFASNVLRIGTENGGTYTTARPIEFVTGGVAKWQISAAGHLMSAGVTDNAYDIGASGANRPRNIYAASGVYAGVDVIPGRGIYFRAAGAHIRNPSSGVLVFYNAAVNDFDRLQLGSTADTHPAIARDGAGVKFTGAATGLTSWIKVPAVAVASLPLAATAGVGARSFVNDALTPVFGSAVTGGGAVTVPVYSTGSAWNVG